MPLHSEKALFPIVVTDSGMVTEVKPLQEEKALAGIVSTLFPMFRVVKEEEL
jgi:hypothetical protein